MHGFTRNKIAVPVDEASVSSALRRNLGPTSTEDHPSGMYPIGASLVALPFFAGRRTGSWGL